MTKLGDRRRGGIPASALAPDDPIRSAQVKRTPLAAKLGDMVRGADVDLPLLGPAYIELVKHDVGNVVEVETMEAMNSARVPLTAGFAGTLNLEHCARILARAVRDPVNHAEPFGTVDEWTTQLDDDVIAAAWLVYCDVRNRLDPLPLNSLSDADRTRLHDAFKKKERTFFLECGVATLTAWLLSGDVQLSTSPTPSSPPLESQSET